MFALRRRETVIAEGLKIVGSVTAEGLVEVNGQVDGELHCTSLILSPKAHVTGSITAERAVVDGESRGSHTSRRRGSQVARACCWRYSSPISHDRERRLF
jgi:cytoskeletal protein CcmA (bactofilin family)